MSSKERIKINQEFQQLLTPLTDEEYTLLEQSILVEGCREPIVLWDWTILDGHNRYKICQKHSIEFAVSFVDDIIRSHEQAVNWIINNQLGRRNITPEQASYLRGKRYQREKKQGERTDLTSGNNYQKSTAAEELADEYKVSEKTIRNDAAFADAVDTLAATVGEDARKQILQRGSSISKKDTIEIAKVAREEPEKAKEVFEKAATAGHISSPKPKPSNLDRLKKLWAECTDEERAAFLRYINGRI